MRSVTRIAAAGLIAVAAAAEGAQIDCERPEAPLVPPGSLATESEIAGAGAAVRAYIAAAQDYLACLEEKEASYGDAITDAEQSLIDAIYNATVEAMEGAAADYNASVQAFRAREDG